MRVRHARPLLNGAIISFGNELDDEGGKGGEEGGWGKGDVKLNSNGLSASPFLH